MRQVDNKKVDLRSTAISPTLAKVRLRIAGIMLQRHGDLELPQSARQRRP
jgi:hypothetical protein